MFIEEMILRCDIKIIYDFWPGVARPLLHVQNYFFCLSKHRANLSLFTINLNKINLNCALFSGLKYLIIFN